jgi:DNA replication and repair protein RecF
MILKKIKFTNFRSHKNFETDLDPRTTVIVGPNAIGKTNVLEGIYMLSTAKPFRAKYDKDVIKHTSEHAHLEGTVENDDGSQTSLELHIQKNQAFENASVKKAKVNKVPRSIQAFAGNLKTVLFSPTDMELLTGSPAERRRYMDTILYLVSQDYKKVHSEYVLAVKHRNRVLEKIKETGRGKDELGFWNTKIVQNGSLIQSFRKNLIEELQKDLLSYGLRLSNMDDTLQIEYLINEISYERLHNYQDREIAAKSTLIGPHRDDFVIKSENYNIAEFGSRGQQRSAVLALKMSELSYINRQTDSKPVLLLDDIFSELDASHEAAVLEVINGYQTVIATTDNSTVNVKDFTTITID